MKSEYGRKRDNWEIKYIAIFKIMKQSYFDKNTVMLWRESNHDK